MNSKSINDRRSSMASNIGSRQDSFTCLRKQSSRNQIDISMAKFSSEDKYQYFQSKMNNMSFGKTEVGPQPKIVIKNKITKMITPLINLSRRNIDANSGYLGSNL